MSKDWYARKLGAAPGVQPAPGHQTSGYIQAPPPPPPEEEYAPAQAQHLRHASNCPECGSANYQSYQWGGQTNHRCYDCGYPVVQSGSGAPSMEGVPGVPVFQASQADTAGTWGGGNFEGGAGVIGRDPAVKTDAPR